MYKIIYTDNVIGSAKTTAEAATLELAKSAAIEAIATGGMIYANIVDAGALFPFAPPIGSFSVVHQCNLDACIFPADWVPGDIYCREPTRFGTRDYVVKTADGSDERGRCAARHTTIDGASSVTTFVEVRIDGYKIPKSPGLSANSAKAGSVKSERKTASNAANGAKGGWPKGRPRKPVVND